MSDVLKLSIAAKPEYISAVRMFISAVAARMNFSLSQIEDIRTAVSEGCTLAMRARPQLVNIDAEVSECLNVRISAEAAISFEDSDADEFSLMLIEAMADGMTLSDGEGRCRIIEMVFNTVKR